MKRLVTQTLAVSLALSATQAFAWGERGHHDICEVATRLVRNPELAEFLRPRGHIMGHLCNIPDTLWRGLGGDAKAGDYTHYLSPQNLGLAGVDGVSLDWAGMQERYDGKKGPKSDSLVVEKDLGSLYWRADQFFRFAVAAANEIPRDPNDVKSEPAEVKATPYDKAVFKMITMMGLMGHFVGDVSVPYHNTADYDGWDSGHGGIHAFYETDSVNALPLSLTQEVWEKASKLKSSTGSVLDRMKQVSLHSEKDIALATAADKLLDGQGKPPVPEPGKPTAKATPPKRVSADEASKKFKKYIVSEMAESARLLADLWDEIYEESATPPLKPYRSYLYPHAPAYVPTDYILKK